MNAAFDVYLAMSNALRDDLEAILRSEDLSQSYRRNFIRASSSLIEGYAHCFRAICDIGLVTGPGDLTTDEVAALRDEHSLGAKDRTKFTLRAVYKMLKLPGPPDFSDRGWVQARTFLEKRDAVMHPKSMRNLELPDGEWNEVKDGAIWLFGQLFGVMEQLAVTHGA
ncbi:MAG: hypothetical protein QM718_14055 [Steroidobacteraceae bacterium]